MRPLLALALLPTLFPCPAPAQTGDVRFTPLPDRVRIEIDGRLFSEYVFGGTPKPYLYPVLAADGTPLTRDFPMASPPGEEQDHPHHRSLWFGHGEVNGHDFWLETPKSGRIVQTALLEASSGPGGQIRTHDEWVLPDHRVVCTDDRAIRVWAVPGGRMLDFMITLRADHGVLTFGDTKEGTMAIRLAQWMTLPHRAGKKDVPGAGHIVNSGGARDAAAWGRRAAWVDYYAPHLGKTYGVAIFDDPRNPRAPTWWHVRDYGLFAANPFGRHDFENLADIHAGDFTIPAGGSATFRYRFYFHEGDTDAALVPLHYQAIVNGPAADSVPDNVRSPR